VIRKKHQPSAEIRAAAVKEFTVVANRPFAWSDDAGERTEQRGLSGAVGTEECDDLAGLELKGNSIERPKLPKLFRNLIEDDFHAEDGWAAGIKMNTMPLVTS
jgi:hypothetical protein